MEGRERTIFADNNTGPSAVQYLMDDCPQEGHYLRFVLVVYGCPDGLNLLLTKVEGVVAQHALPLPAVVALVSIITHTAPALLAVPLCVQHLVGEGGVPLTYAPAVAAANDVVVQRTQYCKEEPS